MSAAAIPLVDLRAQLVEIRPDVDGAIADVLSRTDFILGEDVDEFEREFAAFCEVGHAVALDSGISARVVARRGGGGGARAHVMKPAPNINPPTTAATR